MFRLYRIALASVGTPTIPDWGFLVHTMKRIYKNGDLSAFSALLCNGAKQFRAHLKWNGYHKKSRYIRVSALFKL